MHLADILDLIPYGQMRASVHNAFYYLAVVENLKGLWGFLEAQDRTTGVPVDSPAEPCEVLFNYTLPTDHALGIQRSISRCLNKRGITTGLSGMVPWHAVDGFDCFYQWLPLFPLPIELRMEIKDQCQAVYTLLQDVPLNSYKRRKGLAFAIRFSGLVEAYTRYMKIMLSRIKPKLVIVITTSSFLDIALQTACSEAGVPVAFFPHGFPARLISPIRSNIVAAYAPHHHQYYCQMGIESNQVIPVGWLEPAVTLGEQVPELIRTTQYRGKEVKYRALLISQYSASRLVSNSLTTMLSQAINALTAMPNIERVVLRLHPPRETIDSSELQSVLKNADLSKLYVAHNEPLLKNLRETNMVVGFCSTALLYGPYLNRPALEIRDSSINRIFCQSVLPSQNVYQVDGEIESALLDEYLYGYEPLRGVEVLHNWCREIDYVAEYISNYIHYGVPLY